MSENVSLLEYEDKGVNSPSSSKKSDSANEPKRALRHIEIDSGGPRQRLEKPLPSPISAPRTHTCYVVDPNKGVVKLLNQEVLEAYESPTCPPIKDIVTRLELHQFNEGDLIRIRGLYDGGALFGCKLLAKLESPPVAEDHEEAKVEREISVGGHNFEVRTFVCTVLPGRESAVRILNNQIVEVLEEPSMPPIVGFVFRLDLSDYYPGDRVHIRGILDNDNIFGAQIVDEEPEESDAKIAILERSEEWHEKAEDYVVYVSNRLVDIYGYHRRPPAEVFVEPELPPIIGFTIRFNLDKLEGIWCRFRAVYERDNLWGAQLLESHLPDPHSLPKQRVMDTDDSFKFIHLHQDEEKIAKNVRRVLLLLSGDMLSESNALFNYTLQNIMNMGDALEVYMQTREDIEATKVTQRTNAIEKWVKQADKQGVKCSVRGLLGEVKTGLITEVKRVNARVVVLGHKPDVDHESIFHESVATECSVHTAARIRSVVIPEVHEHDPHFDLED